MDDISQGGYIVKAGTFEGPLELLLDLIEKRKLFINELSLSQVTEDYIAFIRNPDQQTSISDMTYFLVIAATLVLIKSRSLLPQLSLSKDEEHEIKHLEHRLELYQKVREMAEKIKIRYATHRIFTREHIPINIPVFAPDTGITVDALHASLREVFNRLPKEEEKLPEVVVRKVMSIDEMINQLTERIEQELSFSFKTIAQKSGLETPREQKVFVIVSFLALLELVRGGIIDILQDNAFDDMRINKQVEEELFV